MQQVEPVYFSQWWYYYFWLNWRYQVSDHHSGPVETLEPVNGPKPSGITTREHSDKLAHLSSIYTSSPDRRQLS